ncbi:MAG: transposase [Lysobacterales bacterium]
MSEISYHRIGDLVQTARSAASKTGAMDRTTPTKGHRALRQGRVSLPNQVYLLTFCTMQRYPWFAEPAYASKAGEVLALDGSWSGAIPLAWVLMPDHWHGLVELNGREPLGRVIARLKGLTTRAFPSDLRKRIWQRAFHDHSLRTEECILDVGRYILANPVRAGLVRRMEQWPWRGGTLLTDIEGELPFAPP